MSNKYNSAGFVDFPVNNPAYEDTKEGGMIVRLVVLQNRKWATCSDSEFITLCGNAFSGDDVIPNALQARKYYFPNGDTSASNRYGTIFPVEHLIIEWSKPMLCSITVGTTTWCGLNNKSEKYWKCIKNDLTKRGLALYNLLQRLYPKCKVRIQTWIDT